MYRRKDRKCEDGKQPTPRLFPLPVLSLTPLPSHPSSGQRNQFVALIFDRTRIGKASREIVELILENRSSEGSLNAVQSQVLKEINGDSQMHPDTPPDTCKGGASSRGFHFAQIEELGNLMGLTGLMDGIHIRIFLSMCFSTTPSSNRQPAKASLSPFSICEKNFAVLQLSVRSATSICFIALSLPLF